MKRSWFQTSTKDLSLVSKDLLDINLLPIKGTDLYVGKDTRDVYRFTLKRVLVHLL